MHIMPIMRYSRWRRLCWDPCAPIDAGKSYVR